MARGADGIFRRRRRVAQVGFSGHGATWRRWDFQKEGLQNFGVTALVVVVVVNLIVVVLVVY